METLALLDNQTSYTRMVNIPTEEIVHRRSRLKDLDDTIREAIAGLSQSQAGGLVALFLTGEQERTFRVLLADKLALGHRALKRLDDSLGQSESTAEHFEAEPVLKD